jgi:hypothetical protein
VGCRLPPPFAFRKPRPQRCRRPGSPERLHEGRQQPVLVTVPLGQVVLFQYALERFALYSDAPLRAELFARSSYLPLMFGCTFHR